MKQGAAGVEPLPSRTKWLYAAPAFSGSATGLIASTLLNKYYVDHYDVSLSFVSAVVFTTSMLSLYFEVYIGHWGDSFKAAGKRWGRRRPFIAALGPVKEIAFCLLLFPIATSKFATSLWFAILYFIYYMADSALSVTVSALGTELTSDNDERRSLFATASAVAIVGLIFAALMTAVMSSLFSQRTMYGLCGSSIAIIGLVTYFVVVVYLRENSRYNRRPVPIVPSLRRCLRNSAWVSFMKASAVLAALNEMTGLYPYMVQYVFKKDPDQYMGALVTVYALSQLIAYPALIKIMKTYGKLATLRMCLLIVGSHGIVIVAAMLMRHLALLFVSIFALGVGLAGINLALTIILSDCIDYDELMSGKRRESTYQAVSGIPTEFFTIGGRALPLLILNACGYVPNGLPGTNKHGQPEAVTYALAVMLGSLPLILCGTSYWLLRDYPIDEEMHDAVIRAVKTMHERAGMKPDYGGLAPAEEREHSLFSDDDDDDDDYDYSDDEYAALPEAEDGLRQRRGRRQRRGESREVLMMSVEDPITKVMVPIPHALIAVHKLEVPNADDHDSIDDKPIDADTMRDALLDSADLGAERARREADRSAESLELEWLLDYFTARELWMVMHFGAEHLRERLRYRCVATFVYCAALVAEGLILFANKSPYKGILLMFAGGVMSALFLTDLMRLHAVGLLSKLPDHVVATAATEHRGHINKFRIGYLRICARKMGLDTEGMELQALQGHEERLLQTSWWARNGYDAKLFVVPLLIAIIGLVVCLGATPQVVHQ